MNEKPNKALYIVLSLLIAVLFWFFVDSEQGNTITREFKNVAVEFIGETDTLPSRGLMLLEGGDTTVDLELRGPRADISNLSSRDISLQVILTDIASVGTYQRQYNLLLPDNISRSGISIDRASRSSITISVGELFEKTVPVEVNVVGEVADGYIYMSKGLVAQPSVLTLSGREEDVDVVESARIVVDLSGANGTVEKDFDYELLDGDGNVVENESIRVSDKRVEIVAPVYVTKELDLTVKWKESSGSMLENVDWDLEPKAILVAGEEANLENKLDIVLQEIDLSSLLSDTELNLDISLPAGCVNLSGFSMATLSIRFKNLETKTFSVTNISAVGLSDGQRFSRLTNSVDVLVRGPAEELEELTAEDIRIVVDLTDYENGTFSVDALVLVDGYDAVGAVGTYSVACKITS